MALLTVLLLEVFSSAAATESNKTVGDSGSACSSKSLLKNRDSELPLRLAGSSNCRTITNANKNLKSRNPTRLSNRNHQESLAERWRFMLESNEILHSSDDYSAPPSALQRQLLGIETPKESSLTDRGNREETSKSKSGHLSEIPWSVTLSTVTVLGTLATSSLSSLIYGYPFSFLDWKNLLPLVITSPALQPIQIQSYIFEKFLPSGIMALHKMALMEAWRRIWIQVFTNIRRLYKDVFKDSYYNSFWEKYVPLWLRRGVRSLFVKKFQGNLEGIVTSWFSWGANSFSESFGWEGDGDDTSLESVANESGQS